jgi:energy-coupling factor transporter ATP-binding protein EcfA2
VSLTGPAGVSVHGLGFTHAGAAEPALRAVSFEVRPGELVGIVGPNGAGKTTLCLSLNGVLPRLLPGERTGEVRVGGVDPASTTVREMARTIAMVFDDPEAQLSQPTVADEVALGLENLAVPSCEMPARIGEALAAVGLAGLEARDPMTLSGGEQQRLAIACAVATRPSVLVMDEPTANLDPAGAAAVFEIVRRLCRDAGLTVILATHDIEALAEHVDRVLVLDAGAVVLDGAPRDVLTVLARSGGRSTEVRVPEVTALAALLDVAGGTTGDTLPVTVDEALAWLGARR